MNIDDLKDSLLSIDINIEGDLKDITKPYKKCQYIGSILWDFVGFYRTRALLRYLIDADLDGFFEDLMRSNLTYITLLQAYHHKMDVSNEDGVDASSCQPLECAVAANNFKVAQEIDALMPKEQGPYDTDEGFAYTTMLRKLITAGEREIVEAHEKFKDVCKGIERFDFLIKTTQGIIDSDVDMFDEGLLEYLDSFAEIEPDEAEEMEPGEEYICIEALAFIQLAKRKNIPITVTHKMIPPELQNARLIIPESGYPAWPG